MRIETVGNLLEWTRQTHGYLSQCLGRSSKEHPDTKAKWLLDYLADHETQLARTVAAYEKQADSRALYTKIYNESLEGAVAPYENCNRPYARMSYEEISEQIFTIHNQVIGFYRSLAGCDDIEQVNTLLRDLLQLEERETMLLSQQTNRGWDL